MAQQNLVYVGTYTQGESEGIYVYRYDTDSGALEYSSKAVGVENPSFLVIHPGNTYLYAVNEVGDFGGEPSGAISAFKIDPGTGELTFLNQQATGGGAPCHLSVDATGRYVLVANYGGGSVAIFPIQPDGGLAAASDFIQHEGSSVNPQRQQGPHAHSITVDAANQYAFAADLGLDKVLIYRLDLEGGKLIPGEQPWAEVAPGAGPRHFDFHPDGNYAYLINELGSTFTAFSYDTPGRLTEIQTISTLPGDFDGVSHCADIHVHPSGKFVYGSNRGHDSIAICSIDAETGKLTPVGYESTRGKTPRNFGIDLAGQFLLAANQSTNTVVTFQICQETGELTPTGDVAEVPTPVCLKFVAL